MRNFKQNNKFNDRRQTMHKVVCSACGKDCEVPFKPTGDKPVYCNDCFRSKRNEEPRRSGGRDSGRFSSSDKRMYKAVCDKCGKTCEVPFRPTGDKPVYCSECFNKPGKDKGSSQASGGQFDIINAKLDKILEALGSTVKKSGVAKLKKATKEKSKEKKVVAPKKPKVKAKTKPKAKAKPKKKK